jgi:hypothetical protein
MLFVDSVISYENNTSSAIAPLRPSIPSVGSDEEVEESIYDRPAVHLRGHNTDFSKECFQFVLAVVYFLNVLLLKLRRVETSCSYKKQLDANWLCVGKVNFFYTYYLNA